MEDKPHNAPPYFLAARRFFGYALRHDATSLYQEMDTPSPQSLALHTTRHLTASALTENFMTANDFMERQERTLFTKGVDDTRRIIETAFDRDTPTDQFEALAIVQHPNTTLTIARLALRTEDALDSLISVHDLQASQDDYYYRTSPDTTQLENHPSLTTFDTIGCPMAGHKGEVAPDPLFQRFVPWAGELAVRSLYLHKYKKDR